MANAWDYLQKRSAILIDLNSVPLPINMFDPHFTGNRAYVIVLCQYLMLKKNMMVVLVCIQLSNILGILALRRERREHSALKDGVAYYCTKSRAKRVFDFVAFNIEKVIKTT